MNEFEKGLTKYFTEEQLNKIRLVKIGIAGAGGIGSNVAMNLVRCGFSKFSIVDFDKVEASNLNRQFYFSNQISQDKVVALKENLLKINCNIIVDDIVVKVDIDNALNIFKDCDIVVEAFDKAVYKAMLVSVFSNENKFVLSGNGMAGIGNTDEIICRKVGYKLVVVGDFKSDIKHNPPLSPRVSVVAAKMSDIVLEYVLKERA